MSESSGPLPPPRSRMFGVYPALVTDVADPDAQGRVKVKLPWVGEEDGESAQAWARVATLMAGPGRGTWFIPDVDDEVLISFMAGDPRHPVVIGSLWNGQDAPPETMDGAGDNVLRTIKTESGHVLQFDDTSGASRITLTSSGGHELVLDDGNREVRLVHSTGHTITLDAAGNVAITALGEVKIDAPMQLTVNTPMAKFSGVVDCQLLNTISVVSTTYTPGAGNVW